ncbi:GDP-D-glucose phosphorylase 1 [Esox lucius]|uniref:GDP-D-glucose phosphorylase 1 n=1 Tax=Esox lucius TaxID=8010 RepID=A0AAY5L277_ESOLU|nr:GDP-D-glucose phosphorylase 1 [Esox lucius]
MENKSLTLFTYIKRDFVHHVRWCGCEDKTSSTSTFDIILKTGWTDRMRRGFFRYHLSDLETRILPGRYRYVAQLNIQRGIERRKPQEILSIKQNFDSKQFNFNKINPEEIIFEMSKQMPTSQHKDRDACKESVHPGDELCRIMVVVNVSPLEFGHCLFIPEPTKCLPQVLTPAAIKIGIEAVLLSSDPGFRVGFNSLGAFASVNHLHLHGYYLNQELRLETASTLPLVPEKGFYRLIDFPTGLMFYTETEDLEKVVCAICLVTDSLVDGNMAHNLFFTRGCPPGESDVCARRGVRIVVWPRMSCFGAKDESAFNVALCELAGHLPFKNRHDFEHSTEKDVMAIIQRYLLPNKEFLQLEQQLTARLQK